MAHEAADAVKDERPFAGVHILATAILCAGGSSADELELARRILVRDPKEDEPRESESIAGAFNRHMDAAIESVSASRREPTRAARRARLAQDLERERLVLVDRAAIAELIAVVAELREELKEHQVEEFGAELADGECEHPTDAIYQVPLTGAYECGRCGASTSHKLLGRHV